MKYDELKKFAVGVADSFANSDTSLNKSVFEIAQENDLNPEQIKRLCEAANQTIQLRLFPVDPLAQFDLADSNKVISMLNEANPTEIKPDVLKSSPYPTDLLDEYMKKYGPVDVKKRPETKITIISIRKISKQLNSEDRKLASEHNKLARKAEELDTSMRRMIKIAMVKGTYPSFIRAGWELDGKDGMKYVMQKIGFWKKSYINCRESHPINSGNLNEKHPFVESFKKLGEINKRMMEIGVARRRMRSIADKLVEVGNKSGYKISAKDIIRKPLQQTYKAG